MRTFAEHNPIAVAVYFLCVAGAAMFTMDPVILVLSLCGALLLHFCRNGLSGWKSHLHTAVLFLGMTLINPLVSHNGMTVLFVLNHNPVTLEALLYGAAAACMIVAVLYWFRSFSQIMTSDRLLYLFGALSPRLALVFSMALRYVPLFSKQAGRVQQTQKALGLYREENVVDGFRGGLRVFSVMVTWALENGVVTADSMTARGYGIGRRTHYALFHFTRRDLLLLLFSLVLTGGMFWGITSRTITYYPALTASPMTLQALLGYAAYVLLASLPAIIDAKEAIRWRLLRSGT